MKKGIRKSLTGIFTAFIAIFALSFPVAAAETSTFAFDTDIGADMWKVDNTELAAKNNFKFGITEKEMFDGAGSLAVSESFTGEIDPELIGGAYITAADIGLTDFAGCTITAQIFPTAAAVARSGQFTLYTDGMLYLPVAQTTFTADTWSKITLVIPDNCQNTRLGFLTPVYQTFAGDAFYLDEITVTLPDGSTVPNIGDYEALDNTPNTGLPDWLAGVIYAALGIAGAGVIALVIFLIYRRSKRYR
ncbi:MAG: hypothetical protein LBM59_02465 [Ruminococcus sp.]|jgi:hypothetical protein|nr:hypothetical protein [Ruminococcus sp.]